eukprot:CAMPEP_0196598172 /NCGR_PEP_ID=MMETSP1081-20130531/94165_1 /TAXON_ID=36882 /ORGANISM="Pyramimonas amylifera, Strain CCMP720" /LENGTH=593 /DNA_ID=CAMNT_0041923827 /DNA_START=138 /DNA_END=1919 /DNA_ORIENTATION=+
MTCTLLAMLSKEHGITLPVLCAIWDAVVASGLSARDILTGWRRGARNGWWGWAGRTCILAALTGCMAFWRLKLNGGTSPVFIPEQNPAAQAEEALTRGLSYSWLYIRNLGLLVFPHQLCPDWTGDAIPLVTSFWDWRIGPIALLYFVLVGWLAWVVSPPLCVDGDDTQLKAAGEEVQRLKRDSLMMVAWLVIPFVMSMNLITVVGFVMADRVLYLSALGWCMMLVHLPRSVYTLANANYLTVQSQDLEAKPTVKATPEQGCQDTKLEPKSEEDAESEDVLHLLYREEQERGQRGQHQSAPQGKLKPEQSPSWLLGKVTWLVAIFVAATVVGYSIQCYHQNRVWRSEFSLWSHAYSVNPKGHLSMSEYGKSLANQMRYDEAIGVLTGALAKTPDKLTLLGSLGLSYVYTGRCDKALPYLQQGLALTSHGPQQEDLLVTPTEESNLSLAAIFYVGLSHCAPTLAKMGDLAYTAVQTFPSSDFALEHALKVNGYLEQVTSLKMDPRQVAVSIQTGSDGKRSLQFGMLPSTPEDTGVLDGLTKQQKHAKEANTQRQQNNYEKTPSDPTLSRPVKNPRTEKDRDLKVMLYHLKNMRIS